VDIAKIGGGKFNFKRSKVFVKARQLRLREARRLMLTEQLDAATAAFQVGYESPSQFSRESNRQCGAPPLRDITNLRQPAAAESG
jgi:AraC-like DNA-binding protein